MFRSQNLVKKLLFLILFDWIVEVCASIELMTLAWLDKFHEVTQFLKKFALSIDGTIIYWYDIRRTKICQTDTQKSKLFN